MKEELQKPSCEAFRIESDLLGELQVPANAYYGVQTLRGARNFRITGKGLHPLFIRNMAKIKKAPHKKRTVTFFPCGNIMIR